ncbi:metal-dependent phosphohydrolase, HD subdomain protein [Sulfobacillus acidophilus TPY]|nr:metal-dependent phosphohydrolase, HD subdomain protein [Sulfobacillus acidophilus TPY]
MSLATLIATLSRALDLTEGEPLGHAIRSCWIGMQLGEALSLGEDERHELFYALLLKDAGCSANSHQVSEWFGTDDRSAKYELKSVNWSRLSHAVRYAVAQTKPGAPWRERLTAIANIARRGPQAARTLVEMRCTRGADLVRELGWVSLAPDAVLNLDEHWDGSGQPRGLRGHEIPLLGRILSLAQTVEMFWSRFGPEAARDVARSRRGSWFDPELVDAWLSMSADDTLFTQLAALNLPHQIASYDPKPRSLPWDDHAVLLPIAQVFADIVDTKSSWTASHSWRTAHYAKSLTEILGEPPALQEAALLAGLFHDLGKLGVSNLILDKPGPLSPAERAAIETHPQMTYTLLEPLVPLHMIAEGAAAHHERLDGTGYYRHLKGPHIPYLGQIVAVADVHDALAHARPYRRALSTEDVLAIMRSDRTTKLSPDVFDALEWGLLNQPERFVPTA